MDAGEVSVNGASQIAKLPVDQQSEAVSQFTLPKPRTKPLTDRDVHILGTTIEKQVNTVTNRIKRTSTGAIRALPCLSRQLRELSARLAELADEVDAKREGK